MILYDLLIGFCPLRGQNPIKGTFFLAHRPCKRKSLVCSVFTNSIFSRQAGFSRRYTVGIVLFAD